MGPAASRARPPAIEGAKEANWTYLCIWRGGRCTDMHIGRRLEAGPVASFGREFADFEFGGLV